MPNIENIKKAIQVMERVKKNEQELGRQLFDLQVFQGFRGDSDSSRDFKGSRYIPIEEEALNHCGTVCCFIGWLAVSSEFIEQGLSLGSDGIPSLNGMGHLKSIESLLGIDRKTSFGLIHNLGDSCHYYEKKTSQVTVDDVIEKLKSLIEKE